MKDQISNYPKVNKHGNNTTPCFELWTGMEDWLVIWESIISSKSHKASSYIFKKNIEPDDGHSKQTIICFTQPFFC
jgi:hypothetical protein